MEEDLEEGYACASAGGDAAGEGVSAGGRRNWGRDNRVQIGRAKAKAGLWTGSKKRPLLLWAV